MYIPVNSCNDKEFIFKCTIYVQVYKYLCMQIAPIIGGLSMQKQQRILKRCPEIIVATPGRLWELMEQVKGYQYAFIMSFISNYRSIICTLNYIYFRGT